MTAIRSTLKLLFCINLGIISAFAYANKPSEDILQRGKYLISIGGCNDCHTAGFAESGASTPEELWLLGSTLGFKGPWGTTYPNNLRQYIGAFSEKAWVKHAKVLKTRPPMPWWILNTMTEEDLAAMYHYVKSLEPLKTAVPAYLAPGVEPDTLYNLYP